MTITENSLSTRCTNCCDIFYTQIWQVLQQSTSYFLRTSVVFILLPGQVTLDYASEWYNVLTSCDSIGVSYSILHTMIFCVYRSGGSMITIQIRLLSLSHTTFSCARVHTRQCTTRFSRVPPCWRGPWHNVSLISRGQRHTVNLL